MKLISPCKIAIIIREHNEARIKASKTELALVEACEKEAKELLQQRTQDSLALDVVVAEMNRTKAQEKVREIFEEIEKTGALRGHRYITEGTIRQDETHYPDRCGLCAYQALKQKLIDSEEK